MSKMKLETMKINDLKPSPYNPRTDLQPDDKEYEKLKKSIETFGYVEPIILNEKTGYVVGGHQRLKVLKDLGYEEVQVSIVNLHENDEKALNVALNKIEGHWDNAKLKDLLEELDSGAYEVELTGFDTDEIESLMTQFFEEETIEDTSPVDLEENTVIVVEASSENELEQIFTKLVGEGYECRLLTL